MRVDPRQKPGWDGNPPDDLTQPLPATSEAPAMKLRYLMTALLLCGPALVAELLTILAGRMPDPLARPLRLQPLPHRGPNRRLLAYQLPGLAESFPTPGQSSPLVDDGSQYGFAVVGR